MQVVNQSRKKNNSCEEEGNTTNKDVFKTGKNLYFNCILVLSLTAMELTFFIATSMVLHFGYVTKTALITHQCFDYC